MSNPPPDHATDDRSQERATERAAWPLEGLRGLVLAAAQELRGAPMGASERAGGAVVGGGRGAVTLERPPRAELGDYSTNAALLLAPGLGEPPRDAGRAPRATCSTRELGAEPASASRWPDRAF